MEIISYEKEPQKAVEKAVQVLRNGGVVIFPTETSYGLGCDPRNLAALGKIYRIKERSTSKALPLVSCSLEQVKEVFDVPQNIEKLALKYWPGPLTILLEPKDLNFRRQMPVFKDGLAAVRASSHPFVQALACSYKFPIVATSANMTGMADPYSMRDLMKVYEHVEKNKQPDLIIDGGDLPYNPPSTIIKLENSGELEILRQGAVEL
ncbi:MAG: L-threonylcarbamoyladenylate synthase [Patescibacteria group bacterium]|nr:L-threonylcarbamoyladenylate synthase [Patescibacteria group bacterium]